MTTLAAPLQPVVITGLGAVSALGHGLDEMWAALAAGRDGMAPIERFDTAAFSTHLGGMVATGERLAVDDADGTRRLVIRFAIEAGREALRRSGVHLSNPRRVALVLGTSMGSHLGGLHDGSTEVARALGIEGAVVTISTACASSTNALGTGRDLLDDGSADVVIAGGSDVLCPEIFTGFHALGLLSAKKCAPFSESMGTTLGEGAGFVVLERASDAQARGAPVVACLSGYALSADGYHATSPEPSGAGVARALRSTLEDAALKSDDVGYVNAHGTGTAANDPAEWTAIASVLGARAEVVPVSSTKSYLAHAQGAAGVLELIATLLALEHGVVLPTLHLDKPRRRAPADPVRGSTPRPHVYEHALSTNSAFGGANAAVAVSRSVTKRRAVTPRDVFISGVGVLGPFGQTLDALAAWNPSREPSGEKRASERRDEVGGARVAPTELARGHESAGRGENRESERGREAGEARADEPAHASREARAGTGREPELRARLAPFQLEALAPHADTRGLDQTCLSLAAAVALALADARLKVTGPARERTGLFVGTTNSSPAAWDEFRGSIRERGILKVSAPAFTRLVLNATTGFSTRVFGLRGPTTTLTTGRGSGLAALAFAASHLAMRTDADRLVVGAVDETDLARDPSEPDAAVAVVLTTRPEEGAVRLTSWSVGAPRDELTARRVPALASGSLLELAVAFAALRAAPGRGPLTICDSSIAAGCEVVLDGPGDPIHRPPP